MIGKSLLFAVPLGRALLGGVLLAAALPAAEDDWQTHRDDRLGFEISYPQGYTFSQDAALLQAAGAAATAEVSEAHARRAEFVFFLFLYQPGSVAFNPNLNLAVEQLPEEFAELTGEDYYLGSVAVMTGTGVRLESEGDPETRRGYNLSLADLAADAEEHFPLLEAVVETVRFVER